MKDGSGFTLLEADGETCQFDLSGRIVRREDRRGNFIVYAYISGLLSAVTDEFGRQITFAYDIDNRLETVTDFTGRQLRFTYDAQGNLTQARSPLVTGTPQGNDFPSGKRERYVYDTGKSDPLLAHNLTKVIAPNEVSW